MEELTRLLTSWEFGSPLYFGLGSALILFCVFVPFLKKRKGLRLDFKFWEQRITFQSKRGWVLSTLVGITSILMAAVLGDPHTVAKQTIRTYGKPVMLVLDISGSMEAKPRRRFTPQGEKVDERTSFEKARDTFQYLKSQQPAGVDFGLLLFSTENYIARYFAYKNDLLKDTLENKEEIDFISTGTRIAEAVANAHGFLADNFPHPRGAEPDKAIILISDLEADPGPLGEMADAIERARWAGINIYVILIERPSSYGRPPPPVPQIKVLQIVNMNDHEGINQICKDIAAMQNCVIREEETSSEKSLVPVLIPPILGLMVLCLILSETRFRKIP
jgi:hypothetical protein